MNFDEYNKLSRKILKFMEKLSYVSFQGLKLLNKHNIYWDFNKSNILVATVVHEMTIYPVYYILSPN